MRIDHYSIRFLLLLLGSACVHAFFIWSDQGVEEHGLLQKFSPQSPIFSQHAITLNTMKYSSRKVDAVPLKDKTVVAKS
ncbi:hypothetical protein [Neptunomonas antarctica]|uniref:hypothetical protein n=1 Tax=Neptunomonas antarctica TaxID=619304 RepID=UPI0012E0DE26|nr:hypothetical protein [Neptunomonas antarctica]